MILSLLVPIFLSLSHILAQDHGQEFGAGVPAECSELPSNFTFVNQTEILPDPFHFLDGSPVTNAADWDCRAAQLRALFQRFELGDKPTRTPILTHTTSKLSSNQTSLTITAGQDGKSINWTVSITHPPTTTTGAPVPAIIVYDGLSIPAPQGAAIIVFGNSEMGQQNGPASRGVGLFYDLFGANATASSMMAWAWGTSRIIDVIEEAPELGIDPTKIAVTGCSRDGKGALVAGAFDERIVLTIPQESGSGGDACWRTSRQMLVFQNLLTQTATEIIQENVWFSESFNQFGADNYTIGLLPVDHHELAGLVAPRGLYSTENVEFLWLGDWSNLECMTAGNKIFSALGAQDNQGFSQDGPHDHCSFPADQEAEISAFFDKFLFNREANTTVFRTVGNWTFDPSWTPWAVPALA